MNWAEAELNWESCFSNSSFDVETNLLRDLIVLEIELMSTISDSRDRSIASTRFSRLLQLNEMCMRVMRFRAAPVVPGVEQQIRWDFNSVPSLVVLL